MSDLIGAWERKNSLRWGEVNIEEVGKITIRMSEKAMWNHINYLPEK